MSPRAVAQQLVDALGAMLPDHVRIRLDGAAITVEDAHDRSWSTLDLGPIVVTAGPAVRESVIAGCLAALGHVQDFTMRSLGDPWPHANTSDPAVPLPYAEPSGEGELSVGYRGEHGQREIARVAY